MTEYEGARSSRNAVSLDYWIGRALGVLVFLRSAYQTTCSHVLLRELQSSRLCLRRYYWGVYQVDTRIALWEVSAGILAQSV